MTEHARLSASSAHRWMKCAGSARMEAGLPDVDTEYNVEGRAAHELAAGILEGRYNEKSPPPSVPVDLKGGGTVRVPVDLEMARAVGMYIHAIYDTLLDIPGPTKLYIEHQVSLAKLDPPEPMFGTADAIIVAQDQLVVFDLKYGTGVMVEVKENPQLMEYALAAMLDVPHIGTGMWNDARFRTIIIQPRAAHPDGPRREWTYTYKELRDFGHALLDSAKLATNPSAPLTPGPWCRWCKAAAFCPALLKETQEAARGAFDTPLVDTALALIAVGTRDPIDATYEVVPPDPDRVSIGQALAVLDKAEMVEGFIAAIRERVRHEIMAGRDVPGWKLVQGRPTRAWISESQLEQWAMRPDVALEPGELYEKVLRSPAQIEKLVGKKNLPEELYRKVSKSEKLVRAEDPRPALPSSAQKEFAALPPASDSQPIVGGGTGDVD